MPGGRTNRQARAHWFGLRAEQAASLFLRLKGYRIVTTRYKTPVGEIDIIARRGTTHVFVEVKGRQKFEDALHSLKPAQQKRIIRAAGQWLSETGLSLDSDCRFDMIVFSAYLVPYHMKNAFGTDDA